MKILDDYAREVHAANTKWWTDIETGEPLKRNVAELLCLIHSEISEALEGHRKNLKDDKLPQYDMIDVELVDAFIRICDLLGSRKTPFEEIYAAKMAFNAIRKDHTVEHRLSENGKKY